MSILFLILGLCVGSFITMASYRLPRDLPITLPPSACPSCKHILGVLSLTPVFSWLLSSGKCRFCKSKISFRYPLIELLTAISFILLYHHYGISTELAIMLLFTSALLIMIVADLETKLIPDQLHLFLLPLGLIYHYFLSTAWSDVVVSSLIAGSAGLFLHYGYFWLRKKHGLGFGDVKFFFICGLWLANPNTLVIFIFLSGILGVFTGILWKFISDDPRFPFAPSLVIALFILVIQPQTGAYFWQAIEWLVIQVI